MILTYLSVMGSVPREGVAAEAGAVVRAVVPAVPVLEGGPSKKAGDVSFLS